MGNKARSGLPRGIKERKSSESLRVTSLESYRQLNTSDAADFYESNLQSVAYRTLEELGLNTNGLSKLQYAMNATKESGVVLRDDDFDNQVNSAAYDGLVLYRGSTKAAIDNLMYGEHGYLGDGIHGDGIYFSTNINTANSYGSNQVTAYIDKGLAKVVTESQLDRMLSNESIRVKNIFRHTDSGRSAYAIYKGYNVIRVEGGNYGTGRSIRSKGAYGEDYLVPLTRKVLVFREHHKK